MNAIRLFHPVRLVVSAAVRYWEDAEVDGVSDVDGTLIPFREGDLWKPVIDLETGKVIDWPQGTKADIHYKVCDAGEYWLEDATGERAKYQDDYVPDMLAVGESGYGDYIILKIGEDGAIAGWSIPELYPQHWA